MAQTEHKKQTLYQILCDVNIKTLEEKRDQNHFISPTSSVSVLEVMEVKNKFAARKGPVLKNLAMNTGKSVTIPVKNI